MYQYYFNLTRAKLPTVGVVGTGNSQTGLNPTIVRVHSTEGIPGSVHHVIATMIVLLGSERHRDRCEHDLMLFAHRTGDYHRPSGVRRNGEMSMHAPCLTS